MLTSINHFLSNSGRRIQLYEIRKILKNCSGNNTMRINFSLSISNEIESGIRKFSGVICDELTTNY